MLVGVEDDLASREFSELYGNSSPTRSDTYCTNTMTSRDFSSYSIPGGLARGTGGGSGTPGGPPNYVPPLNRADCGDATRDNFRGGCGAMIEGNHPMYPAKRDLGVAVSPPD